MTVPAPPAPDRFDPLHETIEVGTHLYRVCEPQFPDGRPNDGTVFNPGFGKATRFAFFAQPTVPVLYLADTPEGAVHESILHDAVAGSFIPRVNWMNKVLTVVEVIQELEIVSFHGAGLRRLDLMARDLTDTEPSTYARTVRWAEAAWNTGAHGVSYMCRHFNTSKAFCLFGGSAAGSLRAHPDHAQTRAFILPDDANWLAQLAADMRVTIRP